MGGGGWKQHAVDPCPQCQIQWPGYTIPLQDITEASWGISRKFLRYSDIPPGRDRLELSGPQVLREEGNIFV